LATDLAAVLTSCSLEFHVTEMGLSHADPERISTVSCWGVRKEITGSNRFRDGPDSDEVLGTDLLRPWSCLCVDPSPSQYSQMLLPLNTLRCVGSLRFHKYCLGLESVSISCVFLSQL